MLALRRLVFHLWWYVSIALVGLARAPWVAFGSRRVAARVVPEWSRAVLWGARWMMGIRWRAEGLEHLPATPVLIAAKHLSAMDTVVPNLLVQDPAWVLKQELMAMPVFGWYCRRAGMIPIDRDGHMSALKAMVKAAREALAEGRSVVIFPEGTRQEPGAPPDYKAGVAALYTQLGVPCVPVALDTSRVWPAHGTAYQPGTATFRFLEPIPPGLKRAEFMALMEARIEAGTAVLLAGERPA